VGQAANRRASDDIGWSVAIGSQAQVHPSARAAQITILQSKSISDQVGPSPMTGNAAGVSAAADVALFDRAAAAAPRRAGAEARGQQSWSWDYGRGEVTERRQCVFVVTTNKEVYLRDETGGRRFWPMKVGQIAIELIRRDRGQLFVGTVALYQQGVQWWPEPAFEAEHIQSQQADWYEANAWEELIASFLLGRTSTTVREPARTACTLIRPGSGGLISGGSLTSTGTLLGV
jgi:hypothetical protein